jgi:hypothetical protein
MKKLYFLLMCSLLVLTSCAPNVTTSIIKKYPSTNYQENIRVLGLAENIPDNTEILGKVRIGDSGFSVNCGFDVVINLAKAEARRIGGNAIKITYHARPDIISTCHRIEANILKIPGIETFIDEEPEDNALTGANYAILHVYRNDGETPLFSYDLHLDNREIGSVSNVWRESIKITKEGNHVIWAKTKVREELTINFQFGKVYYVRCGVSAGFYAGHPRLERVDNKTGQLEFESIKTE